MNHDRTLPLVSVILKVTSDADILAESLESIWGQEYEDFELIVVHDESSERIADLLAEENDPRIVRINEQVPSGLAGACNEGIRVARGDLIGIIRCGDTWDRKKLSVQVSSIIQRPPDYGVVYSDMWLMSPAGNRAWWHSPDMEGPDLLNGYATDFQAAALDIGTVLIRRSSLLKTGPFDEQLRSCSETDIIIRLAQICRFHHIGQPLSCRRSQPESSGTRFGTCIDRLQMLRKYPETLRNPLFVAHQAEMIRRSLWLAGGEIPRTAVPSMPDPGPGFCREPVPEP